MNRKRVGIVLFDEIEVLDFCGPFEVFSVTRLNEEQRREEPSPFETWLIAESSEPVSTTGGMQVLPTATFATCPALDILVVPGGWGTRREMKNDAMLSFVSRQAKQVETLTSVCTGADPGKCRSAGRTARDDALAFARSDARALPERYRRDRYACGRRRQCADFSRHFRRHRHGVARRAALLRGRHWQGDSAPHGISVSRIECATHPPVTRSSETRSSATHSFERMDTSGNTPYQIALVHDTAIAFNGTVICRYRMTDYFANRSRIDHDWQPAPTFHPRKEYA